MDKRTAQRILADPEFDPAQFIGDMILHWLMNNAKTVAEHDPRMIRHMLQDEQTWPAIAEVIPCSMDSGDGRSCTSHSVIQFANHLADSKNWHAGSAVNKLLPKMVAFAKTGAATNEFMASMVGLLKFSNGGDFAEAIGVVASRLTQDQVIDTITSHNQTDCKVLCQAVDLEMFKDGAVIQKLIEQFRLKCPVCNTELKSKPGYSLHIKWQQRSVRGMHSNNRCYGAETVFDVVKKRLGIPVRKSQAWW